MSHYKQKAGI